MGVRRLLSVGRRSLRRSTGQNVIFPETCRILGKFCCCAPTVPKPLHPDVGLYDAGPAPGLVFGPPNKTEFKELNASRRNRKFMFSLIGVLFCKERSRFGIVGLRTASVLLIRFASPH